MLDVGTRALIEGGKLSREHGWVADLSHTSDGVPFITLSTKSTPLKQIVGSAIQLNEWLSRLVIARNVASDQALLALAKSRGVITTMPQSNKWQRVPGGKKKIAALEECPETAMVPILVTDEDGEVTLKELKCMFSAADMAAPRIELTQENMQMVVRSLAAAAVGGDGNRGRKRPRSDRVVFEHPEIKYRPSQRAAYIAYCNPDGKVCYHQERCDVYNDDGTLSQEEIARVSATLHAYYVGNHNGPAVDDHEEVPEEHESADTDGEPNHHGPDVGEHEEVPEHESVGADEEPIDR